MVARKKPAAKKRTVTRKTTTRRKTASKKSTYVDPIASKSTGDNVWVLDDVPFGLRLPGVIYDKVRKTHLFIGRSLSPLVAPYASKDFSMARWIEDGIDGPKVTESAEPMIPRWEQSVDIDIINTAIDDGSRGFFLTSQTGTGKTIVSVHTALNAAERRVKGRKANILVIANRPASICIPDFRRTIQSVGTGGHRWLVTTVDRVHKVDDLNVSWDVIIVDEAHGFRSVSTRRSKSLLNVTKGGLSRGSVPFVLWMTATPAHDPTELTYLAPLIAQQTGELAKDWAGENFVDGLARNGFHITKGRYGAEWSNEPQERAQDISLFRSWLTSGIPKTLYREAPWGQAPIDIAAVELDPARMAQYQSSWENFRHEMDIAKKSGKGDKGLAAIMRWRQKALLLRVPEIVEWSKAQLDLGNQVVVYTDFVGLGAEPITESLMDGGIGVSKLFGNDNNVSSELSDFYSGSSPVAVTTMSASINLQAGAIAPDGTKATSNPRVGLISAPIYSGLKGRQVIGRTHRDGQVSEWVVMATENTVEEKISRVMIERFAASDGLAGADTSALKSVAELIGADWLDLSKVEE